MMKFNIFVLCFLFSVFAYADINTNYPISTGTGTGESVSSANIASNLPDNVVTQNYGLSATSNSIYVNNGITANVVSSDTVSANTFTFGDGTSMTTAPSGGGADVQRIFLTPDMMDFTSQIGFPVSGSVSTVLSGNATLPASLMDDTVTQGRHAVITIDDGKTNVSVNIGAVALIEASGATASIFMYHREVTSNISAPWVSQDLGDIDCSQFQNASEFQLETKVSLATLGWTAGKNYQIIIVRATGSPEDDLVDSLQFVVALFEIE